MTAARDISPPQPMAAGTAPRAPPHPAATPACPTRVPAPHPRRVPAPPALPSLTVFSCPPRPRVTLCAAVSRCRLPAVPHVRSLCHQCPRAACPQGSPPHLCPLCAPWVSPAPRKSPGLWGSWKWGIPGTPLLVTSRDRMSPLSPSLSVPSSPDCRVHPSEAVTEIPELVKGRDTPELS